MKPKSSLGFQFEIIPVGDLNQENGTAGPPPPPLNFIGQIDMLGSGVPLFSGTWMVVSHNIMASLLGSHWRRSWWFGAPPSFCGNGKVLKGPPQEKILGVSEYWKASTGKGIQCTRVLEDLHKRTYSGYQSIRGPLQENMEVSALLVV